MPKPIILVFVGCYLPGYKAGGPIRSIANMVARFGDEFDFYIITSDRDLLDSKPYLNVVIDGWNTVGKAKVFYASSNNMSLRSLSRLIRETPHDVLYLNSFFSPVFAIRPLLARYFGLIPKLRTVVAPRGEFSPGALGLKWLKKRIYIAVTKVFGLCHSVIWQASSEFEELDIRRHFGKDAQVISAPDLPPLSYVMNNLPLRREKIRGCLKILFLSRISRKKNLLGALEMLNGLKGQIQFNVYGPIEDRVYWTECQKVINSLPGNIKIKYCGNLTHEQVIDVIDGHDLFFFPTLGENFGHVILEAFCAGCPVLISDQTPWRGLEKIGVGWDLPLVRPELFKKALQLCIDMDKVEHKKWCERAQEHGLQVIRDGEMVNKNRLLFGMVRNNLELTS